MSDIVVVRSAFNANDAPTVPAGSRAITKSDTDTYDNQGDGIVVFVGTAGDVAIVPNNNRLGSAVTFKGIPAGSIVPCRAYKVMSTNTSASDLVALS